MQITIFVDERHVDELANFLSAEIKYEHKIDFSHRPFEDSVSVQLFYDGYVLLKHMKI